MLIAFLALLGVDLVVLLVFVSFLLGRKRWVRSQAGAFPCALRVADGAIDGLGPKWHRGHGRWVRDVLVFTRGPLLLRNDLLAADGLDGRRPARPGEVKRLGDHLTVIGLRTGGAVAEIAAADDVAGLLLGPYDIAVGAPLAADGEAGRVIRGG